jgi:hypothetical protein
LNAICHFAQFIILRLLGIASESFGLVCPVLAFVDTVAFRKRQLGTLVCGG